ncbi:helix-turn-helix domain-containing protein [Nocardia sp. CDC160]|uniref:helix-turn-helix domain-containing protein n=1 Tax=Nocardia sp. CDC160 TaxID=3112166 RepID=UPI002DBB2F24|nr:helix-turn-helix domain-containing protein [Nocardia sp. CDC160]MEC3917654.1 helix-turn-helix domain-containing protein [Nocardia sp. CDC160]
MAWEIARPSHMPAVSGVDMAGFRIRGDAPEIVHAIPHPAITVVIEFGDRGFEVRDAAGRTHSASLIRGLAATAVPARVEALDCVQVRLSPLVAPAILGFPPAELGADIIALEDVWGREAARLREQLHDAPDWPHRFALVEALLARRSAATFPIDPEVAHAWSRIMVGRGRFRVEDLADELGWSRQRLWSRFGTQIGLTPKRAAKLVRFDHAVHRLVQGHAPARVAAETGYADQSHLTREVREFTGAPPTSAATEPWLTVDDRAWPSTLA